MERAVDMTSATSTLTLKSQDWTYGDHILKVRSWFGTLAMENITPEFECMAQTVDALLKTQALGKSFWGWKMLMFNCWKLIVFIF